MPPGPRELRLAATGSIEREGIAAGPPFVPTNRRPLARAPLMARCAAAAPCRLSTCVIRGAF